MSLKNPFETRQMITTGSYMPFIFANSGTSIVPNELISADMAFHNSDLYSVTSLISADVAGAKFTGSNVKALAILNKPSHLTNRYSFWQTIVLELLLSGNAFATIGKNELRYIPNQNVSLDLTDDVLTYQITPYGDYQGGTFQSDAVLHFKIMAHGVNGAELIGHSPLESLANEIQQQEQANRLSLSTIAQAINPTSIIKVPDAVLSPEAKTNVRSEFEKANTGSNAGRTLVLDQSADFQSISINADVAKFLNNAIYQRTQISKAFGVPDSYLNGQGDQQSNIDMIQNMYVNGLNRYIEPIISEIQTKFSDDIGLDMSSILDYSNATLKQDLLNFVDKGIIDGSQALSILESKGIVQL
ncbi:phage portal protein [Leuconostoc gelidum subsp. gelidum]|uniref:Phage portal protein n=1 Tax=Leuconostoc gelidum subsp. gelidum TaxID=1607839 RepID=A0ABS7V120_LEUGE|nr:phage portal protein [Leuconostoc gelidum]MBZ5977363.1 phage portal protein [Leuconostoc gelidum subsp. gelidum]MBZ5999016.1 phage portal protein [Leuconostoc gelidum subsp. gelidum]